jgi:hypothetical protein
MLARKYYMYSPESIAVIVRARLCAQCHRTANGLAIHVSTLRDFQKHAWSRGYIVAR